MGIRVGADEAANIFIGSTAVSGIYVGDTQVWSPIASTVLPDPSPNSFGWARTTGYSHTMEAESDLTVSAGRDRRLLVWLVLSHTNWLNDMGGGGYNSGLSVTSHLDGAFTRLDTVWVGSVSQRLGSISLFELDDPTPGLHTILGRIGGSSGQVDCVQWVGQAYRHVAAVTAVSLTTLNNTNGALANTVTGGSAGDLAVCGAAFDSAPTGLSGTQRGTTIGASVPGATDFAAMMDADGSTNRLFSTSSTAHRVCSVGARLTLAP